jgi:hypothetical protein
MKATDWKTQIKELWNRVSWTGTAAFTLPNVLFEIQPDFVMAARLSGKSNGNGHCQFAHVALEPLGPGTVAASPAGPAVLSAANLAGALAKMAGQVGNGQNRAGVLLPDGVARVSVFPLESVPANGREAATLLGWKMRETLPFPPEEARLTYQAVRVPGAAPTGEASLDVIVVAVRSSVLSEFEVLLEGINRSSAMILPATMALLPLLPSDVAGGQFLLHVYSNTATYAVLEGQRLRFWRSRDFAGLDLDEFFNQVAAEAGRVVASTEDRLSLPLERVWLCTRPPASDGWADQLAGVLGRDVERLEPPPEAAGLLTGEDRTLFRRYGATLAGLAANRQ